MSPTKEHARSLLWLSLLGAVVCVFCVHVGRAWDFTADDASVSWSYARNLAGGHGLVLTPGAERVEAAPSLLWVLLLTLAAPLHLSHAALAKGLGLLCGAGALVAVAYLPAVMYRRRPRGFDLIAPALAATFAHVAQWTASGTESPLVALTTALAVVAFAWEENHPERLPWSAVVISVAFAARPDAALVLVALGLVKTARALRRGMNRQDVLWGILLTLGLSAQELFRLAYFAEALPNGFRVRLEAHGARHLAGLAYLRAWASAYRLGVLATNSAGLQDKHWIEFFRRLHYADQHFSGFGPGWRSDMGRIYVRYGPPDQIEQRAASSTTPQLELWFYNQPYHRFVFADREGFGRYTLVQPSGE